MYERGADGHISAAGKMKLPTNESALKWADYNNNILDHYSAGFSLHCDQMWSFKVCQW